MGYGEKTWFALSFAAEGERFDASPGPAVADSLRNLANRMELHRSDLRDGEQWTIFDSGGARIGVARVSVCEFSPID